MDVERRRVHGRGLRDVIGCVECIGRGDYVYGSGERAGACDCDADGEVGYGYK